MADQRLLLAKGEAPFKDVMSWFDDALDRDDPKPSQIACEKLARDFKFIINRHNNAALETRGPVCMLELKDVSPAEELDKRVHKVISAADQLLFAAAELTDYAGGYRWEYFGGVVTLHEIEDILTRIGARPRPAAPPSTPARGKRRSAWTSVRRQLAYLVREIMRGVGYSGGLSMKDSRTVTSNVCAAAISWALEINVTPDGFADAMRMRQRGQSVGLPQSPLKGVTLPRDLDRP